MRWVSSPKGKEAGSALLEDLNQYSDSIILRLVYPIPCLSIFKFSYKGPNCEIETC